MALLSLLISSTLDGITYAMMLYMAAVGLTIIFGLMEVFNLAHGALFGLGAYLFITLYYSTQSFLLSVVAVIAIAFLLGAAIEFLLIKPIMGNTLLQLLVTIALLTLTMSLIQVIWPAGLVFPQTESRILSGMVEIFGIPYRLYKFAIIAFGSAIAAAVQITFSKTLIGARLRAAIENRELASVFGMDTGRLFLLGFSFGIMLAVLGGALVSPVTQATIDLPTTFTLLSFVIPVIGGMKSYRGALYSSFIIGFIDRYTAYFLPQLSFVVDLLAMIIVLLLKPEGLFER